MSRAAQKLIAASGGEDAYEIEQSLMFARADSAKLEWNPGSGATSYRKWTFSAWVKRGSLGSVQAIFGCYSGSGTNDQDYNILYFGSGDELHFGAYTYDFLKTNRKFRDVGAWYHIMLVVDTTLSTNYTVRKKIYINGVQETSFAVNNLISQNYNLGVLRGNPHYLGWTNSTYYYDGYLAEVYLIDNLPLTPSSFGETDEDTGAWIPKEYTGTFPGESTYLKFVSGAIGTDSSGQGNNWTTSNLANADVVLDTPTNNHCTLNPPDSSGNLTTSQANTKFHSSNTDRVCFRGSIGVTSGKWYFEYTDAASSSGSVGVATAAATSLTQNGMVGNSSYGWAVNSDGAKENGNSETASYMSGGYTTNDVIGVALNMDDGEITFYKNGSSSGVAFSNLADKGAVFPAICTGSHSGAFDTLNFGQMAFEHTAPSGYKAWNTSNLPIPTIKNGGKYFNTVLYTGSDDAAVSQSVTGVGFAPDLIILKRYDDTANPGWWDKVRGEHKGLSSATTGAQATDTYGLESFNSDGFTVREADVAQGKTNTGSMLGWCWKAGGSGSSNSDGAQTTTVSANQTSGFSIVTATGTGSSTTYGHGLGVEPKVVLTKGISAVDDWYFFTSGIDGIPYNTWQYNKLNTTGGFASDTATAENTTTFNMGYGSGVTFVAYCFADVPGFSQFGIYEGNGSATGPFKNLNFRPAWIMIKKTSSGTGSWFLYDTKRSPGNVVDSAMWMDAANATTSDASYRIDLLSNGFQLRGTNTNLNGSGTIFFYMAFAENPFKYANAR